MRHLLLKLQAPVQSFGREATSSYVAPTADFPFTSYMVGLLGNALGYDRKADAARLQDLQASLVMASVAVREGRPLKDYQIARKEPGQQAWAHLTFSNIERHKHYWSDREVVCAVRGEDLDEWTRAVQHPKRVLYLGRRGCLPSAPLYAGVVSGETALESLHNAGYAGNAQWPVGEGTSEAVGRQVEIAGLRDWTNDWHKGYERVYQGYLP